MTLRRLLRGLALGLIIGAAILPFSLAQAQESGEGPTTPPIPAAGAPIYQARCANCHGPTGQGDGAQAVQAGLAVPDLSDPALLRETTPARWFDVISNGVAGKAMPPFGEESSNPLRRAERWDLVFYLYTLGTPPAQIGMGEALYEQNCIDCHGEEGGGNDEVAVDLGDMAGMATRSQADLFAAIADTSVAGHDLALGEVEIWAVADYVRAFGYNYSPPASADEPSAPGEAPAATNPFVGGEGVVSGQVINGTGGTTPPSDLVVSLRAFDLNAAFVESITTTVGADGAFRFEGIDPTAAVQLEPLVVYQSVPYFGDLEEPIVLSEAEPEANVTISVYETTPDPDNIRIERLHIVLDFAPGQMQVAELYILSNVGDKTYVGTLEEGTLRLTVPPDAVDFQPGGDPNRYRTLADGIADTAPIRPGQSSSESVLVYDMAYDGALELSRPLPFDVSNVNVFVEADAGVTVSGPQLEPGGLFQAQNTALETFVADNLAAGESLTLQVSGAPQVSASTMPSPHQRPGPNQTQGLALGAASLVGAAALCYLYWQGHLTLRPKAADGDQKSALLQAIADLDDGHEAGRVKEEVYRRRRAQLKEELVGLMEGERTGGP